MDTQMTRKHQLWNVIQLPKTLQKFRTAERKLEILSLGFSMAQIVPPSGRLAPLEGADRALDSRTLFILHGQGIPVLFRLMALLLLFLSLVFFCFLFLQERVSLQESLTFIPVTPLWLVELYPF